MANCKDRKKRWPQPEKTNTTLPREITSELIRSMRAQGRYEDADQLLKAWQNKGKQEKKQLKKEIIKQEYKKKKIYAIKNNLCTNCVVIQRKPPNPKPKTYALCDDCRKRSRISQRKIYYEKKKEAIQ